MKLTFIQDNPIIIAKSIKRILIITQLDLTALLVGAQLYNITGRALCRDKLDIVTAITVDGDLDVFDLDIVAVVIRRDIVVLATKHALLLVSHSLLSPA